MTTADARGADRLRGFLAPVTLIWVGVYAPLETYITWDDGGAGEWLSSSYVMDVIGILLMFWSAWAAWRRKAEGPALLATGWAWTAATFWRATANRFWWAAEGRELYAGPSELWLAVILTAIAVAMTGASIVLVLKSTRDHPLPSA
jgi:hypothetical protein